MSNGSSGGLHDMLLENLEGKVKTELAIFPLPLVLLPGGTYR